MGERPAISARLRFQVLQRDGFACCYCGAKAPAVKLHLDHIIPVAHGGRTELENLQAACSECNHGKGPADILGPPEVGDARTLQIGFWLAIAVLPGTGQNPCIVGQLQALDERGLRITLVDWIGGRADSWDYFVPWAHIGSMLVCTPAHSLELFGEDAAAFQERAKQWHERSAIRRRRRAQRPEPESARECP